MIPASERASWLTTLGLMVVSGAVASTFAWVTHSSEPSRAWVMLILGVMVLLYVAGAWSTSRGTLRLSPVQVVWVGLIARLVLAVGSFPHLSDDVWRYMWDGHMQVSGLNPYSLPPASEALAPLRTEFWPLINHPEVPTIYPPAAQLVFAMVMALGGSLIGMRLVMVAVELATLGAVWRLMGRGEQVTAPRRSLATVLLWWNPLMMVEFASSGHLDMLAIAALVWALALIVPQRIKRDGLVLSEAPLKPWPWWWAGVWIGLSASFKLLGMVALAPLVVWAWWPRGIWTADVQGTLLWSWRRALARVVMVMAGCAVVLVATAVPYVTPVWFGESGSFAKGLSTYARKWQANAGLFAVALEAEEQVLETVPARPDGGQPWWRFDALADLFKAVGMTHTHEGREVASTTFGGVELAAAVVKLGVALVLGLLLLLLLYQRFEPDRIVLVMLAALLLLAPTVHPWYVAWLVPLSVAQEGRARSLVVWSVLVLLIYADQVMGGTVMLRLVEYGVVLPYALLQGWRSLVGLDMEGVRTA